MANTLAPERKIQRKGAPLIDPTGSLREAGIQTKGGAKPPHKKKKGGAMNAPPLKGSDTSVSSPKRQTAEAVRI